MVQLLKTLIEKYVHKLYYQIFNHYLEKLDVQLCNINQAIRYIQIKKQQLQLIIDKQTVELENKYIEIMEEYQIKTAQNIYCIGINQIKEELNEIENEYAQLETYALRLNEDKADTKEQCHVLQALINAC
ncbi:hypothetical protein DOS77_04845 [Staphylococcus felis]|uniref:Uncharacterized protein n=1 Tax=Staphylococcus felis TaxID=46127 RepID=A0A2K3ZIK8_9STAP|nr:hypothetical protein [Staphylococcus felis]AVP37506.1 hypothetical protein C7J90_11390 [Staphylococcus felis]PNZ37693.1 hypothetical protein CD143_01645 [Staphylococcus felis]QQB02543.1 hypothetical protein I6H71_07105 [Staphylococcus felis]REH75704.1 hypothetical protein DOS57_09575 [Staphylococcus felis]REH85077.1 hypothetical protein DOS61_04745 [Staphylococcus felis]